MGNLGRPDRKTRTQQRVKQSMKIHPTPPQKRARNMRSIALMLGGAILLGGTVGAGTRLWAPAKEIEIRQFGLCHTGGGTNCVVDGDTIWLEGTKIRIADIDAPETHSPRCPYEADLGNKATLRLQALLNVGAFNVTTSGGRDVDRYGRELRVITRSGKSLGASLASEGLARMWDGARKPWC
jgi:micrococcal nuclease